MKKRILLFMLILLLPITVNAKQIKYSVTATCKSNYNFEFVYDKPTGYNCSNGNSSPFANTITDTCRNLGSLCNRGEVKSCYVVIDYDCNRTKTGANFTTTTTTTRTTRKTYTTAPKTTTTTTTTTTQKVASNTKLSSLSLSSGEINFNKDVYEYRIEVANEVDSINVNAVPEDSSSKVEIKNNTNITNGSVISIIVTGTDGTTSEYKIVVSKKEKAKSSNNYLSNLTIKDYELSPSFDKKTKEYTVIIDSNVKELVIDYDVEDENAMAYIMGNENLKDGSVVEIGVIAEDESESIYIINIKIRKKSNFIKILFSIILILSLLAGAYYIYKKYKQSKSGDKYEYE